MATIAKRKRDGAVETVRNMLLETSKTMGPGEATSKAMFIVDTIIDAAVAAVSEKLDEQKAKEDSKNDPLF